MLALRHRGVCRAHAVVPECLAMRVWLCKHPEFSQSRADQQIWGDAQNAWALGIEGLFSVPMVDLPTVSRDAPQVQTGQPLDWSNLTKVSTTGKVARFQNPHQPSLERAWLPPQQRVGEASHPGPLVLTCNSNSWKNDWPAHQG
eukprot:4776157-Amphidinium_carterae.1